MLRCRVPICNRLLPRHSTPTGGESSYRHARRRGYVGFPRLATLHLVHLARLPAKNFEPEYRDVMPLMALCGAAR